ncbi:hypothetical protein OAP56_01665 [Rickettsiaceae bacterium]|nr:hypothetical protein [Rickettsiaceae bacterium]
MRDKQKHFLDEEEKEILGLFEDDIGESLSTKFSTKEIDKAVAASGKFLTKSERINIRMNSFDLNHIKRRAVQEGIPYQTLISSILHKYASRYS